MSEKQIKASLATSLRKARRAAADLTQQEVADRGDSTKVEPLQKLFFVICLLVDKRDLQAL
jgi:hypothetical protein